jgi:hypothetical protein
MGQLRYQKVTAVTVVSFKFFDTGIHCYAVSEGWSVPSLLIFTIWQREQWWTFRRRSPRALLRPVATTGHGYPQQASVIERLESIEGLRWNLATANCEQIVRWAVEGKAHSDQLAGGVAMALLVGAVVFLASGA